MLDKVEVRTYKHSKSGELYTVLEPSITHATNGRESEVLVIYTRADGANGGRKFAREINEFKSKFEAYSSEVVKEEEFNEC